MTPRPLTVLLCLSATATAAAPAFIGEPSQDRWIYSFNSTPGTRGQASTFSPLPDFNGVDDRWGFFLFAFDTAGLVPAGLPAAAYRVTRASVSATTGQADAFEYDPTYDVWSSYATPVVPAAVPDNDPGRPVELHGAGFRGSWTAANFTETSPYGTETPGTRNAYPLGFTAAGQPRDVSNNITQQFDSRPWAVARTTEVNPGDLVPLETRFNFEIDPAQPGVGAYLAQSLAAGRIWFSLTSLHPAVQQGGEFVSWITRDDAVHQLFGGLAPSLEIEVTLAVPVTITRDGAEVIVSWPAFAGFTHTLESSPDLGRTPWSPVTSSAATTAGTASHRATVTPGGRFFRIHYTPSP